MTETELHYPHIAARLFNTPLLIEPDKLRTIAHALSARFGVTLHGIGPAPEARDTRERDTEKPKKPYQIVNGIGVIPVFGTLVHRSSWMDAMSGLTSYDQIGKTFDAALSDNDVDSILLQIDSPGGEAQGVFDLADRILNAQTDKPIIALADGHATSAAYLIGSAADQLFVSQSATLGSIGVRMLHVDQSRMNDAHGLTVTEIFAGARKADGTPHAPLNEASLTNLQARVNDFYDLFVDAVARNRGIAASQVRATEAGIYIGAKAIPLGLADGVRTLEQILSAPVGPPSVGQSDMSTQSDERRNEAMEKFQTAEALATAYPEHAVTLRTEATQAERARIKEILSLAPVGHEALAKKLAFEESCTPGDAAVQFLAAQKTQHAGKLAGFLKDGDTKVDPLPDATQDQAAEKTNGEKLMEEAAERRNQERRARRGSLQAVQGGRAR